VMSQPSIDAVERIYLAMGCFWGAEEIYWLTAGVTGTSVGYMGGMYPNPSYEEVCTGRTGHTETVCIDYDPSRISTLEILRVFWEQHDPTQGMRQGNDVGTQYRSAIFTTTDAQFELAEATRDAYRPVLSVRGYGDITTEIAPAESFIYYPAEQYHQRYLEVHPNGYRCHSMTGVPLPALA
ncbi:MAG: peptide-methionine (S)-S-oxide reductase MsrA, partial [Candidatus Nanopelagicales bacterium]